jgi:hypothetical protein
VAANKTQVTGFSPRKAHLLLYVMPGYGVATVRTTYEIIDG